MEPESNSCGRRESVLLVDEERVDVEDGSTWDGEGREVKTLLAGRMSEARAALSRRVAAGGIETYSKVAITGGSLG